MQTMTHPTTAADIGHRVLNWIVGIHGTEDLSSKRIEDATGIRIVEKPSTAHEYGFGRKLSDRWFCTLRSLPASDNDARPERMMFSFDDQTGEYVDFTEICSLDFDDYANALKLAGFAAQTDLGPRDAFNGYVFTRGSLSVWVEVRGESAANPRHLCVSSLIIDTSGARFNA